MRVPLVSGRVRLNPLFSGIVGHPDGHPAHGAGGSVKKRNRTKRSTSSRAAARGARKSTPHARARIDLAAADARLAIERAKAGLPLSGKEVGDIFRVKHAQSHNLAKAGAYDAFLLKFPVGNKRYSGVKVYRYLCGDPVYEPTFGRKRNAR
jgi:hypothetical protein